ncbi:MAG: hypothetical protein M1530_03730 [Candidatus Marsarchaeota archaeon]|nr:hypothetical protein [Candidatus Marsarchaeota archaeon]
MDINDAWKSTCKTIFGREIGGLEKYEDYLHEAVFGMEAVSAFSKKSVMLASDAYAPGSRFFDYQTEQLKAESLSQPFDINAAKDIDSLAGQIHERLVYAGNKVLGKCENVVHSDAVFDSINVLDSSYVARSKNAAHCFWVRDSENAFGCASFGFGANVIRSYYDKNISRTFEVVVCEYLSDSMFCYNTFNCSDLLFCFNLRNQHHRIANIQLDKDRYNRLKAGLAEQISGELERKGRMGFSMMDVLG